MCLSNLPLTDITSDQGGYRSPDESGQKGSAHQEIVHMHQPLGRGQTVVACGDSRLRSQRQIALYSDRLSLCATSAGANTFSTLATKVFPHRGHQADFEKLTDGSFMLQRVP
ncbi:hypothetical protein HPDFL43_00007360 [Hoeflea phototrophica DFL-43]|uniref:Uncharacterized protein n=1 Tax=Hoeflea phototrophica (strain DSM 17068 / NCIMB 14078 / DFL-43) TaxID=411684 RepID=A0A094YYL3_HOEPD|nr:hypothetical protein HPDFL43_00007360 [Hoeflea phototrophica DFL-43]